MGPAASQMEQRGIATEKGNINREIAADNKLLKEIKARITRLYNWSKEQSAQPQGRESIMDFLFQARPDTAPTSQYARGKALKADVNLFNFLMRNGISSMEQLYEKVSTMNISTSSMTSMDAGLRGRMRWNIARRLSRTFGSERLGSVG